MPFETPGAVMLLEIRLPKSSASNDAAADESLSRARVVLEAAGAGRQWNPASGSALAGSLVLADAAMAFPFLHRLRTELRAEPGWPRLEVVAGLGRGDESEGTRLAGEAFRSIGKKRRFRTRALTPDAASNVVLGALCSTLDSLHTGWTRAQWQAVYRRDGGKTLQEIGRELGIAYQNVSKRLIAAQYSLYGEVSNAAGLVFTNAASPRR